MVMERDRERDWRMKGVLAPFPLPGAPLSQTTSLGATRRAPYLASKRDQHSRNSRAAAAAAAAEEASAAAVSLGEAGAGDGAAAAAAAAARPAVGVARRRRRRTRDEAVPVASASRKGPAAVGRRSGADVNWERGHRAC